MHFNQKRGESDDIPVKNYTRFRDDCNIIALKVHFFEHQKICTGEKPAQ